MCLHFHHYHNVIRALISYICLKLDITVRVSNSHLFLIKTVISFIRSCSNQSIIKTHGSIFNVIRYLTCLYARMRKRSISNKITIIYINIQHSNKSINPNLTNNSTQKIYKHSCSVL